MAEKRFDAEIPEGTHLGVSRDSNGAYRGHLFDDTTNKLVGHVELTEVDEEEVDGYRNSTVEYVYVNPPERRSQDYDALVDFSSRVLTHYIDRAVERWAPPAKAWVVTQFVEANTKWQNKRQARRAATLAQTTTAIEVMQVHTATEVVPADLPGARAGPPDAQKRLLILLVAGAIVDEWQESIEAMSPEEVEGRISLILEQNPSWLEEFMGLFQGGQVVEKEQVLRASERIKEALRLPPREL